jgi:hypothetical protein
MKTLNNDFIDELVVITKISEKVNGQKKDKIFQMIKEHSYEIEELYKGKNDYRAVETVDITVLCFALLIADKKDINIVFNKCLPRFHSKLDNLSEKQ